MKEHDETQLLVWVLTPCSIYKWNVLIRKRNFTRFSALEYRRQKKFHLTPSGQATLKLLTDLENLVHT